MLVMSFVFQCALQKHTAVLCVSTCSWLPFSLPPSIVLLPKVEAQEQAATPVVQLAHSQPLPINCLVTAATVASVDQLVVTSQQCNSSYSVY